MSNNNDEAERLALNIITFAFLYRLHLFNICLILKSFNL
jgi:hypothetical protein